MNRQYLDPVFLGQYPEELPEMFGDAWPDRPTPDMALIRQPIDFLGINYYTRGVMRSTTTPLPPGAASVPQQPDSATRRRGWEVYPAGADRMLEWVQERYGNVPLYITENGAAFYDPPSPIDGRSRRPAPGRVLPRASARGAATRSQPASTCAATSPGRCSTTSSGASASRSGSASSTWTTRRRSARRRRAGGSTRR